MGRTSTIVLASVLIGCTASPAPELIPTVPVAQCPYPFQVSLGPDMSAKRIVRILYWWEERVRAPLWTWSDYAPTRVSIAFDDEDCSDESHELGYADLSLEDECVIEAEIHIYRKCIDGWDLNHTIVHELGHALLGPEHNNVVGSLMYHEARREGVGELLIEELDMLRWRYRPPGG